MKFNLVWSLFKNSKKFTIIFIINFIIGISGILFLEHFKDLMNGSLELQAKTLQGSDLVVNSRFPILEEQRLEIEKSLPKIKKYFAGMTMNSMVASSARGRLVQIVKLGNEFPFFGGLEFLDKSHFPQNVALPDQNTVWVYPEILAQLEIKEGDSIKIGKTDFIVGGVVIKDSLKAIRFSGFVPRVYMIAEAIERAGLVQAGSTARFSLNYVFSENFDLDQLEEVEKKIEAKMGAAVSVNSPRDASERVARMTQMIADFMSLISLICLLLSFVSLFYLYTGFLQKYRNDLKILFDLGVKKSSVMQMMLFHFFSMVSFSAILVYALAFLLSPLAEEVIARETKVDLSFDFDSFLLTKALLFLLVLTPSVVSPLFDKIVGEKINRSRMWNFFIYIPLALLLIALSASVTEPAKVGLLFSVSLLSITGIVFIVGYFLLKKCDYSGLNTKLIETLALKRIVRKANFSLPIATALILSTALFSLGPQIGFSLIDSISLEKTEKPLFFLFDIQDDQLTDLNEFLSDKGVKLNDVSPLVRAQIVSHNGRDFKNSPESDEDSQDLRNRLVNLSYREQLFSTEKIVEGKEFSQNKNHVGPREVSIEKRYAKRQGIEVGDQFVFDVLGLEIESKVVNIRTVQWTDFIPNFFILFEDGVFNDAPKTYLATIPRSKNDPNQLILDLNESFSNISVVNVEEVIADILTLISSTSQVLNGASLVCMFLGLLMIFIIIHHQMSVREADMMRLKIVGVTLKQIRRSILIEFTLITIISLSLGLSLSVFASWLISQLIFEGHWAFQRQLVLAVFAIVFTIICLFVTVFTYLTTQKREALLFEEI